MYELRPYTKPGEVLKRLRDILQNLIGRDLATFRIRSVSELEPPNPKMSFPAIFLISMYSGERFRVTFDYSTPNRKGEPDEPLNPLGTEKQLRSSVSRRIYMIHRLNEKTHPNLGTKRTPPRYFFRCKTHGGVSFGKR